MPHLEADIPEKGQQFAYGVAQVLRCSVAEQDQQVDVGSGVQFTAPVAADRDKCQIAAGRHFEAPGMGQQGVDQPGADLNQITDRFSLLKQGFQPFVATPQGVTE